MKNLYNKSKGKIYPSPTSAVSTYKEVLSILKLLPATILVLVSTLQIEEQEVLAYLITRSVKAPYSIVEDTEKNRRLSNEHKPLFDCGCFHCYTSFWYRWDSSPNRELIHQAIEAFEEHLSNPEPTKEHSRTKKKSRRVSMEKKPERMKEDILVKDVAVLMEERLEEVIHDCVSLADNISSEPSSREQQHEGENGKISIEQTSLVIVTAPAVTDRSLLRKSVAGCPGFI